jgi:recombinational DNA repair protein RecT
MTTTTKTETPPEVVVPAEQPTAIAKKKSEAVVFREAALSMSHKLLDDWVGPDRANEAAGRISIALAASAANARNPQDFYDCTLESIGRVVAISALTGIMPSTGAVALAYAVPRRPRKGEKPQLQYMLSHRGINALANRAGMHMVAIPISNWDKVKTTETGEVIVEERDIDKPPKTEDELRGVMLLVKQLDTGRTVCSGWVAKSLILERRAMSDGYNYAERAGNDYAKDTDPWHKWFTEQAMKTAMHYAIGRGWCVIDDTEAVRALQADAHSDIIDGEVVKPQGRLVAKEVAE